MDSYPSRSRFTSSRFSNGNNTGASPPTNASSRTSTHIPLTISTNGYHSTPTSNGRLTPASSTGGGGGSGSSNLSSPQSYQPSVREISIMPAPTSNSRASSLTPNSTTSSSGGGFRASSSGRSVSSVEPPPMQQHQPSNLFSSSLSNNNAGDHNKSTFNRAFSASSNLGGGGGGGVGGGGGGVGGVGGGTRVPIRDLKRHETSPALVETSGGGRSSAESSPVLEISELDPSASSAYPVPVDSPTGLGIVEDPSELTSPNLVAFPSSSSSTLAAGSLISRKLSSLTGLGGGGAQAVGGGGMNSPASSGFPGVFAAAASSSSSSSERKSSSSSTTTKIIGVGGGGGGAAAALAAASTTSSSSSEKVTSSATSMLRGGVVDLAVGGGGAAAASEHHRQFHREESTSSSSEIRSSSIEAAVLGGHTKDSNGMSSYPLAQSRNFELRNAGGGGGLGYAAAAQQQHSSSSSSTSRSVMSAAAAAAGRVGGGAAAAAYHHQSSQQSHHSTSTQRSISVMGGSSSLAALGNSVAGGHGGIGGPGPALYLPHFTLPSIQQLYSHINSHMSLEDIEQNLLKFDDLERLDSTTNVKSVEDTLVKYCGVLSSSVEQMKQRDGDAESLAHWMAKINDLMTKAWEVPAFGLEMGNRLCDIMRNNGGLDILIASCASEHPELQFNSARLLQQCLVTENRGYVVDKGLEVVVAMAKDYTKDISDAAKSRVGVGVLEHLFKHCETTCGDVIAMGGLDSVVNECKSTDVETLRHCASALANVAMYGGAENQEAMIKRKVPAWLFPLAFHSDDTVKYYACLAIAALVANKEIEAAVTKSGTLDLIEPFVQSHTPRAFAEVSATHSHGQSANWLKRLIPVLNSHREEARNLAAFHFCMEAEIKKQQRESSGGNTGGEAGDIFRQIGAVDCLKKVASSPNGIASKYAAQTLRLIGEEVPHKLSQQVPTWSVEDVKEWVKQIGFPQYSDSFAESRVDGDLLLQLSEEMLREDIAMRNGILRRRFLRELSNLKRVADYSSVDPTNLNAFLCGLGVDFGVYTYDLIMAGIDRDTLMNINDEQLLSECGIRNKIHRLKIGQGVKIERGDFPSITDESGVLDKSVDVFISYRRSNGSQLASLLKVHLELRNISVYLDVVSLETGNFNNNLLQSIRSSRNLVLVCTPGAFDRCIGDDDQNDWIHKEVACALQSQCNIIPVFDNFAMPEPVALPESMRAVTNYNGVKWIHDYQEACVDKIARFIGGDSYVMDKFLNSQNSGSSAYSSSTATNNNNMFNRQNTYGRTLSNDASTCSDDANNNLHGGGNGKLDSASGGGSSTVSSQ